MHLEIALLPVFLLSVSCQINQPPNINPNMNFQNSRTVGTFNNGQMSFDRQSGPPQVYQVFPAMPDLSMMGPRMNMENRALAILTGNSGVRGMVFFQQRMPGGEVQITGNVTGLLPRSTHGFHIHQYGDMSNGCTSMGAHFNPNNMTHGEKTSMSRHIGDLGNVIADQNGVARLNMNDSLVTLNGPLSIAGRGVVIHELADDLGKTSHPDSRTTGNAGSRIACGVIGLLAAL